MSTELTTFSKEAIKARMLQNAAKIWGLKNVQSVDPFVKLLIEAFSAEIFKVNSDVHSNSARILERTAKLLAPSIYTFPRPAHGIAFVTAAGSLEQLPHHCEFFLKKLFTSSVKAVADVQIDIPFTPIDNVRLIRAQVALQFAGSMCYAMDEGLNKIPIARIHQQAIDHRTIVLAIDVTDYAKEKIEKLSLFCANPTFEHLDWVYKLLPFIEVTNLQDEISISSGLSYPSDNAASGYEELIQGYSIHRKIQENIKSIYAQQFIELSGFKEFLSLDAATVPDYMATIAAMPEVNRLLEGKRMLWLRLKFPPQFSTEILDTFSFALNAFPVYNRGWKQNGSSLDITGNNIPLVTEVGQHFLYVSEVADGKGRKYTEIPFSRGDELTEGLYSIRLGGMERFDERNAIDSITHVLELTRDEVAAFGNLARDTVIAALKEMMIHMKVLDRKMLTANEHVKQETNYVIVEPIGSMEHVYVAYWISHCDLANNIRIGVPMTEQKLGLENNKTIKLLTQTMGGAQEQTGIDAIQAFRYALTTRDKIISAEDIKNYCRLILKDKIKEISVKRGTIVSTKPKEGFIRTLEIEIVPFDYGFMGENYWTATAKQLGNQIAVRAIDGIEYVVTFLNQDVKS